MHTTRATSRLADVIESTVRLPEALFDEVLVFLRNPHGSRLTNLDSMIAQPWEGLDESVGPKL
jgi:hypothetical protein